MTEFAAPEQLRHVVQAAGLAPSVHNTQPWRFVLRADGLELHADPMRQLPVLDPDGRQLHISCGAALYHARAASRAIGLDVDLQLLPDDTDTGHLATLLVSRGAPAGKDEISLATAILHRHTSRSSFLPKPVPADLLEGLRLVVAREGAVLKAVVDPDDLVELEVLLSAADTAEERDELYRAELEHWVHTDNCSVDGMSSSLLETSPGSSLRQRDFSHSHPDCSDGSAPLADHPFVVVLATAGDDAASWLQAGQALAALLLRAAEADVQAQPLGQVTDQLAYRLQLRSALSLVKIPQMVLRMGYAKHTTATARRDVDDLLASVPG